MCIEICFKVIKLIMFYDKCNLFNDKRVNCTIFIWLIFCGEKLTSESHIPTSLKICINFVGFEQIISPVDSAIDPKCVMKKCVS